jgi:flagellar hook-associated protein 1 FlgK
MKELLEIGKSGLLTSNRGLSVTSNNISNAGTEGYSRQRVEQSQVDYKKGGWSIGIGVTVDQIVRLRSDLLTGQIQQQETALGELGEKNFIYTQLEGILHNQADGNLDNLVYAFFEAFNALAAQPENITLREDVIRKSGNLVNKFQAITEGIDEIETTAVQGAKDQTIEINRLLKEIAELNTPITRGGARNRPDNYSLDIQDKKLTELSKLVDFSVTRGETGAAEVKIGGIVVINADRAETITPEIDLANNVFRLRLSNGVALDRVGGTLGARIDAFKTLLPEIQKDLDTLAGKLVSEVNTVHKSGFGLSNTTGINFFNPDGTSASSISINQALISDPRMIASSASSNAPGNNAVARQIANLSGKDLFSGRTPGQFALSITSGVGSELANTRSAIETTTATRNLLVNQQEEIAGVNIDEELTNMIKYQTAYQASAKVLQTASTMMDTLLGLV